MEKPDTSVAAKVQQNCNANLVKLFFTLSLSSPCDINMFYGHTYPQAVSFISFIFVVVSTVGMTLNTMPSMRHRFAILLHCTIILGQFRKLGSCKKSQIWSLLLFPINEIHSKHNCIRMRPRQSKHISLPYLTMGHTSSFLKIGNVLWT